MSKILSAFKYRAFNQSSIELFINRELWFAKPDTLNDPFECQMIFDNILKSIWSNYPVEDILKTKIEEAIKINLSKAGICSFSQTKKNQLMWSHYADEHRGFCIEFDRKTLVNESLHVGEIEVIYQSDYPHKAIFDLLEYLINYNKTDISEAMITSIAFIIMRTKYTHWSYERELRLTRDHYGSSSFSTKSVKSISLGLRMDERDKKTLRELLSTNEWSHVRWFQAQKSTKKFGLVFNKI